MRITWLEQRLKNVHRNEIYHGHGLLNFHTHYCEKTEKNISNLLSLTLHFILSPVRTHTLTHIHTNSYKHLHLHAHLLCFLTGPRNINKWNNVTETRSFGMVRCSKILQTSPNIIKQHLYIYILFHLFEWVNLCKLCIHTCFSSLHFFWQQQPKKKSKKKVMRKIYYTCRICRKL